MIDFAVKKRKKKNKVKKLAFFLIALFFVFCVVEYFIHVINPLVLSYAENEVSSFTSGAVNEAIYSSINFYDDLYGTLIEIEKNEQGNVTHIQTNPLSINKIARDIIERSTYNIEELSKNGLKVPLGLFTGIPLIGGIGPKIPLFIDPMENSNCNFLSQFSSCGINQTIHKIYLEIACEVDVAMPVKNIKIKDVFQVLICESVIVGEIPNTFLQLPDLGSMQTIIPETKNLITM